MCEHRLTADKREMRDFPKLPSATSFIRKTLGEMLTLGLNIKKTRNKFLLDLIPVLKLPDLNILDLTKEEAINNSE